ncbi:lysR substrate binding domain-containing protein [Ditylenchus destructor]|nr:lysR substrate binding domain-containing protein [Ditylenchus destructor]
MTSWTSTPAWTCSSASATRCRTWCGTRSIWRCAMARVADSRLVARKLYDGAPAAGGLTGVPEAPWPAGAPVGADALRVHPLQDRRAAGARLALWRRDAPPVMPIDVTVQGRRSADDGGIAHQWALEGRGLTYKSELDIRDSLASGALVEVMPEWVGRPMPLHALMPSHRFLPLRVKALVDHLAQGLRPSPSRRAEAG